MFRQFKPSISISIRVNYRFTWRVDYHSNLLDSLRQHLYKACRNRYIVDAVQFKYGRPVEYSIISDWLEAHLNWDKISVTDKKWLNQFNSMSYSWVNQHYILTNYKKFITQYSTFDAQERDPERIKLLKQGHCSGFASTYCIGSLLKHDSTSDEQEHWSWYRKTFNSLARWNGKKLLSPMQIQSYEEAMRVVQTFQKPSFISPDAKHGDIHLAPVYGTSKKVVMLNQTSIRKGNIDSFKPALAKFMKEDSGKAISYFFHCADHATAVSLSPDQKLEFSDSNSLMGEVSVPDLSTLAELLYIAHDFDPVRYSELKCKKFGLEEYEMFYFKEGTSTFFKSRDAEVTNEPISASLVFKP